MSVDFSTYVGLVLTIVGLVLTIIAFMLSWGQWLASRHQTKSLTFITDTLSTKYLGAFPEFIPQIGILLSKAKNEILIACNFPAYGVYSSHDGWISIKHALEIALSPNHKVNVSCVFSNKSNRRAWLILNLMMQKRIGWTGVQGLNRKKDCGIFLVNIVSLLDIQI